MLKLTALPLALLLLALGGTLAAPATTAPSDPRSAAKAFLALPLATRLEVIELSEHGELRRTGGGLNARAALAAGYSPRAVAYLGAHAADGPTPPEDGAVSTSSVGSVAVKAAVKLILKNKAAITAKLEKAVGRTLVRAYLNMDKLCTILATVSTVDNTIDGLLSAGVGLLLPRHMQFLVSPIVFVIRLFLPLR